MSEFLSVDERRVDRFDYALPAELIAQIPIEPRDASQLLVVDGGSLHHQTIRDLPVWLNHGDLVVVNNTKVNPARIACRKQGSGGRVELLLLHRDPSGLWTCLAKPYKSIKVGGRLEVVSKHNGSVVEIEVIERRGNGEVAVRFVGVDVDLDNIGSAPLPPYIRGSESTFDRYQTIYANVAGSAAAPTAGLHITTELRDALRARGVGWAEVTLHIGLDTFRPITAERIDDHHIHREWCSLSPETARAIATTRECGGRVVAIGTTTARTLESWATLGGANERGFEGWSDLFITPGYDWRVVDAMVTNFHLPRSTLLMMVSAFAGEATIKHAYAAAIERRYRFYSFGDAMLLLPERPAPTAGPSIG